MAGQLPPESQGIVTQMLSTLPLFPLQGQLQAGCGPFFIAPSGLVSCSGSAFPCPA